MTVILSIDPGSRKTGFGVIRVERNQAQYVSSGTIRLPVNEALGARLRVLFESLSEIIDTYQPAVASIESVFMAKSADSALKLGHARGAAMVACVTNDLEVYEYAARQIKQSVVGTGAANKLVEYDVGAFVRKSLIRQWLHTQREAKTSHVAIEECMGPRAKHRRAVNRRRLGASKSVAKKASAGAANVLQTISDQASPPLAEKIRHAVQVLRRQKGPVTTEQLNGVAVLLVRAAGATGWRQYEAGQDLSIRIDGRWIDAEVFGVVEPNSTKHRLRMHEGRDGVQELHPWNHALRELPSADFHEALNEWKTSMRKNYAHIFDAVLGRPLDVLEQCVTIDVVGDAVDLARVKDVGGLSAWLHELHQQRCKGTEAPDPTAALLTGPPAAGKVSDWSSNLSANPSCSPA